MCPTLVILLRQPLSEQQRAHISARLRVLAATVTSSVQGYEMRQALGSWHVWGFYHGLIGATAAELAALTPGMGVHIAVGRMSDLYDLEAEAPQYLDALGFVPVQCLVCEATNRTPVHHRLLGQVALVLADLLDGYIGFTYPALPPTHPERFPRLIQSHTADADRPLLEHAPTQAGQERGQVCEIYIDLERGDPHRYYTVVDARYFRQWLQQPRIWLGE